MRCICVPDPREHFGAPTNGAADPQWWRKLIRQQRFRGSRVWAGGGRISSILGDISGGNCSILGSTIVQLEPFVCVDAGHGDPNGLLAPSCFYILFFFVRYRWPGKRPIPGNTAGALRCEALSCAGVFGTQAGYPS